MSGAQQIRDREKVVNMLAFLQNSNVVAIRSDEEFKKFVGVIQAHGFSALIPWPAAGKGYDDYVADSLKRAARFPGWDGKTLFAECQIGMESIGIYPYTEETTEQWYGIEPFTVDDII